MTLPHWQIRKARSEDADALTGLIDAAYAQYAGKISDLPPVSEGCAEDITNNQVWVAVEGAFIIGCLVLVTHDGFIKLANLAVRPDHGGNGLGRHLIALAESEAEKQGYNDMRLNTHVAMPENVKLYSRLGWEEVSRTGNTVTMRKLL